MAPSTLSVSSIAGSPPAISASASASPSAAPATVTTGITPSGRTRALRSSAESFIDRVPVLS